MLFLLLVGPVGYYHGIIRIQDHTAYIFKQCGVAKSSPSFARKLSNTLCHYAGRALTIIRDPSSDQQPRSTCFCCLGSSCPGLLACQPGAYSSNQLSCTRLAGQTVARRRWQQLSWKREHVRLALQNAARIEVAFELTVSVKSNRHNASIISPPCK